MNNYKVEGVIVVFPVKSHIIINGVFCVGCFQYKSWIHWGIYFYRSDTLRGYYIFIGQIYWGDTPSYVGQIQKGDVFFMGEINWGDISLWVRYAEVIHIYRSDTLRGYIFMEQIYWGAHTLNVLPFTACSSNEKTTAIIIVSSFTLLNSNQPAVKSSE